MSEAAVPQRIARPNGWWGMVLFVATELTLFGMIFGSYFYIRFQHAAWPPPGIPRPEIATPLILALVLEQPAYRRVWRHRGVGVFADGAVEAADGLERPVVIFWEKF